MTDLNDHWIRAAINFTDLLDDDSDENTKKNLYTDLVWSLYKNQLLSITNVLSNRIFIMAFW